MGHKLKYAKAGRHAPLRLRWFGKRNCTKKVRYKEHAAAKEAARKVEHASLISEMTTYWCVRHGCWHVSHAHDFIAEKRFLLNRDFEEICNLLAG